MSRSHAGAPPAPRTMAAAIPFGGQKFIRRLVLCYVVFSMLSVFSPLSYAAKAATTQDPIAAWSCRGIYHVVGRGQTLYSIARRYGTTAYRIAVCNGLASYTVYVGQTLLVPTARG